MQHPPATRALSNPWALGHWLPASTDSMQDKSRDMSGLWAFSSMADCIPSPRQSARAKTSILSCIWCRKPVRPWCTHPEPSNHTAYSQTYRQETSCIEQG
eukprot:3583040-Pleurochrysis_carterae.AAC.7